MRISRRLRSLFIFVLAAVLVAGGVLLVRTLVLTQVRSRIQTSLHYARLRLSVLPPAVILEDVRSASASPFFSARKITLRLSPLSLFEKDKPLTVILDQPVFRVYERGEGGARLDLQLPFSLEKGFIRDGEVFYWSPDASVRASGIKAAFRSAKDAFVLHVAAGDCSFLSRSLGRPLEGRVQALVEGKGSDLTLHRLSFEGEEVRLKLSGILTRKKDLSYDLRASFRVPASLAAGALDLPFRWEGAVEGQAAVNRNGNATRVRADLLSRDLVLNGLGLGRIEGTLRVGEGPNAALRVTRKKGRDPAETIDFEIGPDFVEGRARGLHLDPVIRDVGIPWPVRSPATGTFRVQDGHLTVKAEFQDDLSPSADPGRYPFRGPVDFFWDGREFITFSSARMESAFGRFRVDGRLNIGGDVSVKIAGDVDDVRQGRAFASHILGADPAIPELRGRGTCEIGILGSWNDPHLKIVFSLAPGGFDRFDVAAVEGEADFGGREFRGFFKVFDPDVKGDFRVRMAGSEVEARAHLEDGLLERILPAMNLELPFKGRAAGDLEIVSSGRETRVEGGFRCSALSVAGLSLADVRANVAWQSGNDRWIFSGVRAGWLGGMVEGGGSFSVKDRGYDLDLEAKGIALSALSPNIGGRADVRLKGRGFLDADPAEGTFAVRSLRFADFPPLEASGTLRLSAQKERLEASLSGRLDPGGSEIAATAAYPEKDGSFFITAKGTLTNPDLFMPWKGVRGEVGYLLNLRGSSAGLKADGAFDVKGSLFPFPGFPHALTDFSGFVRVQDNVIAIRSLRGTLAGGEVNGSGEIRIGPEGRASVDIRAEGRGMALALLEKTRMLADASLRLTGPAGRFSLSGEILARQLSWRRELDGRFALSPSSHVEAQAGPSVFDGMALDIRLRADDNALMENSLGRIQGRFDLTLTGTVDAPVLLGDVEAVRGDVYFQDRKFRVVRARLSFANPAAIEPYLDFRGETFLKDYRVTFTLSGLLDRLRPEFASSPALPPEDVLALLALGESFKRTYSYEVSTQMGTGSLLSFQLAEEAKKRAEKLFALDSIRIDPFVLGASSEMTARLTVGKKISRNINLLYSTNLSSQREDLVRLEWEFSDGFALVGMRDERGRLSLDAKIRKRF